MKTRFINLLLLLLSVLSCSGTGRQLERQFDSLDKIIEESDSIISESKRVLVHKTEEFASTDSPDKKKDIVLIFN